MLVALTPEQRRVLNAIVRVGGEVNASPKELKAAVQTGLVEANLTNPSGGDQDSVGWRQERASIYGGSTLLEPSIRRFFQETSAVKDRYGRAGDLAAAVQRPREDLRGKYQQRSGEADELLRSSGAAPAVGAPGASRVIATPGTSSFDPGSASTGDGLVGLLGASMQKAQPVAAPQMLEAPSFSSSRYVNAALPMAQGAMAKPRMDVGAAIAALEAAPAAAQIQRTPGSTSVVPAGQPVSSSKPGGGTPGAGKVTVFNGNPGRLQPELLDFAKQVSSVFGKPLRIDSGANHSKYTVDGNVSDHYAGNATDIPAKGPELLRLGRAALITAGMPRAQAMKATGGLYNVAGHQIIFLTNKGGNHYDHLHVSAR